MKILAVSALHGFTVLAFVEVESPDDTAEALVEALEGERAAVLSDGQVIGIDVDEIVKEFGGPTEPEEPAFGGLYALPDPDDFED